jgi:hypothetical protein
VAREAVPAEVWVEAPEAAEVEWVGHLQQGRAEVVYARNVATRFLML